MKALSIKQPWASLIAHGIKDIENRTWKTHFRGRIYIHVSAKTAGDFMRLLTNKQLNKVVWDLENYKTFETYFEYSAIIGEVDIIDCVVNHDSIWAEKTDLFADIYFKPTYNWVLANPVLYEKSILNVKGKLSFWDPTPNQTCMNCDEKFFGQDLQYCCNGNMCGCLGQPIEPVVCSEKCYHELVNKYK
jgi:hypothetical protein